jgi:fructose-1,6-bisphosphatase/inositol monophosphatase family enzyme
MGYLPLMKEVALEAGSIMKKHFMNVKKEFKADRSVVTAADKEINDLVDKWVKKNFPNHDFFGEEGKSMDNDSECLWVCDPIDGTRPFIFTIPTSVFSLGLVKSGKTIAAVVNDPWLGRMFYASKGKGAFVNGKRIHVSDKDEIDRAEIALTFFRRAKFDIMPTVNKLYELNAEMSDTGSIVHMAVLTACGIFDATIFPHDTFHDAAAIALIIEEAGGVITWLDGKEQDYDKPIKGFVCANPELHKKLVDTLKGCYKKF